jgi:hypothetical protein
MSKPKPPWVLAAEQIATEGWKPHPERVKILVTVFTYDRTMSAECLTYTAKLFAQMSTHPRCGGLEVSYSHGYPTDRARNYVVKSARENGFGFVLMLDNDMKFDANVGLDPNAKPFLPSSLEFALEQPTPVFVGSPYCSSPPSQDVVVMKHREYLPDMPNGLGKKLDKYTRDEAAVATGIERVAALPTGCLLFDLRAFDILPPPWFYYEYTDPPYNTALASTEDVVLTRNADWLGISQYVNWDAWSNHLKYYEVGKPRICPVDSVPRAIWESYQAGAKPQLL